MILTPPTPYPYTENTSDLYRTLTTNTGQPIGYIRYINNPDTCHILEIEIQPIYQGYGWARHLLTQLGTVENKPVVFDETNVFTTAGAQAFTTPPNAKIIDKELSFYDFESHTPYGVPKGLFTTCSSMSP
jgi:hypothetical protein